MKKKLIKKMLIGCASALVTSSMFIPSAAHIIMAEESTTVQSSSETNPSELLLGMFFNSHEDRSDTLYVSFNGTDFESISVALQDRAPNDATDNVVQDPFVTYAQCLHDPALQFHNGVYWTMSGFTKQVDDGSYVFQPMLSYSTDLINWSYPNSGGSANNTNTYMKPTLTPYGRDGKRDAVKFDCAAPDLFIDDDGTGWIVVCLGYYGAFHGEAQHDHLSPYLIKADNLRPGTTDSLTTEYARSRMPLCTYSQAYPMNLVGATSTNYIDASIYKENGIYYLSIKRDGTINEIWKTDSLTLNSKWTLACANAVEGYEGPSLTRYNGRYLMYTDKLADFPYGNADGTTGTFVTESDGISGVWGNTHRIDTKTIAGAKIPNRHGSVLRITDKSAINTIMELYRSKGGVYKPESNDDFTGVKEKWGTYRVFKNGEVDVTFTGIKEAPDKTLLYFKNGVFDSSFTGVASDENKNYFM